MLQEFTKKSDDPPVKVKRMKVKTLFHEKTINL